MQAVLFACFIPANICVTGSDLQINGMPLEAKRPQRETIFIRGAAAISKMPRFDLYLDSCVFCLSHSTEVISLRVTYICGCITYQYYSSAQPIFLPPVKKYL